MCKTVPFEDVEARVLAEPGAAAEVANHKRAIEDALALAGAWAHLDWEQTWEGLDRIRHESTPTPPVDFDL